MTDVGLSRSSTYAQVRIGEPAGERVFGETPSIGGEGADVVVPGVAPGAAVRIERHKGVWVIQPTSDAIVRFNGRLLAAARDLRDDDVIAVGDAQVIVTGTSRTLLRLEVCHLVGNATVAPSGAVSSLPFDDGADEEVEIRAPEVRVAAPAAPVTAAASGGASRKRRVVAAATAAALLIVFAAISLFESVPLDIQPGDARIRVPGTLLAIHWGPRLLLLPGVHTVRAERNGYIPAQASISVGHRVAMSVRLRLAKLPGKLHIDTHGVAATVSIDGQESGRAPALIEVPSGQHTITLGAPHYVDFITTVDIAGAGQRQELSATLQPSWGSLVVSAIPVGAHISVDGADRGSAPAVIEAPSGVRRIRIFAPGLKPWESSVVLKAGEALTIGPIVLGQPDAQLVLRSEPAGADVTIGGSLRGRTPITVDLPAGVPHEVAVNAPGYAPWTRSVFGDPGRKISVDARLEAVLARVTVQGEPNDAELIIDGSAHGRTPQSLSLPTIEHRIEVRKAGFAPFLTRLTPEKGFDRTLQYRLTPEDRSPAPLTTASVIYTQTGYMLRRVPVGSFTMGSGREPGRRTNEGFRKVTLKRAYYLGITDVTNEQFRRFRADHNSGLIGRRSINLDAQPVTQVSWDQAAEYCNWLSEQDSLPPAYEKQGDRYVLRRPVTIGYRLPTEAEWEYAARYVGTDQVHLVASGEALPVSDQAGRNVSEWMNDYYESFAGSAPVTDPLGPTDRTRHVIRGAGWKSAATSESRLAWRDSGDGGSATLGFRVARYAE